MTFLIIIFTILFSFFCGAIPTGFLLVKKFRGIDIRTKGSGNIGSTNVKRIAGAKISAATQAGDIIKGIIPVAFAICLSNAVKLPINKNIFLCAVAIAAIIGHNYTPFLGFNGGKGVNTTLGAFVLLAPVPTFSAVAMYFLLRLFTPIVSIRSIILGLTIPAACIILGFHSTIIYSAIFISFIMIIRHKGNLIRLFQGKE